MLYSLPRSGLYFNQPNYFSIVDARLVPVMARFVENTRNKISDSPIAKIPFQ
jgi:hypothetical protein